MYKGMRDDLASAIIRTRSAIVYTDGACDPNPGRGGWAAIMISDGQRRELSGSEPETTNNRMEMMGAIQALTHLNGFGICRVKVFTDSQYLIAGIKWTVGWRKNHWLTKKGEPVKNQDLWERLAAFPSLDVKWEWVRGHAGSEHNERADYLATKARLENRPAGLR